jgi:RNA-binding protein
MTGKQARFLRSLGHHLEPCLIIGKQGITPNVIKQVGQSLKAHELVKVKIPQTDTPEERYEIAEALAKSTRASLVQVLGRTVLLHLRNRDKPKIILPTAKHSPAQAD